MRFAHAPNSPVTEKAVESSLTVIVLFTDVPHTLAALREAARLAGDLNARLQILCPVVVPYPLALTDAPVNRKHLERRLRTVANGIDIPTRINVVYCRDTEQAVEHCLEPGSVLVVSWRRRWLFDKTTRLIKRLRAMGHHIVAVDPAKGD